MAAHPATISSAERTRTATADAVPGHVDWRRVASLLHASRALDDIEESRLLPERKVLYQFSARGHDFAQILLGLEAAVPPALAPARGRPGRGGAEPGPGGGPGGSTWPAGAPGGRATAAVRGPAQRGVATAT